MNFFEMFTSMLKPWQWAVMATIPPAIISLYFLKLRRHPLEVPSTYLWHRTIEDLHVNTIWQRAAAKPALIPAVCWLLAC